MARTLTLILAIFAVATPATAEAPGVAPAAGPTVEQPGVARTQYQEWIPPEMRDIGIDEKPGTQLPLDLKFFNERGEVVALSDYFDGTKPVLLQLGYFECPQLCGQITQGMVGSMRDLTLNLGDDYRVLYVSFDPAEQYRLAAQKKQSIVEAYERKRDGAGLHLLTGEKRDILELARAVGYKFKWVESQRQYSHPAAIMVFTPDGQLSRYLYGMRFDPRTLRLSLVEAGEGKIGTTVDRIMLICFMYDGSTGRYGPKVAMLLMRGGGALTVVLIVTVFTVLYRREYKRKLSPLPAPV
ncbi:MAG TPA: SCO family protein [Tepidisphaeraceae bacterium]|nr:SCO family protein [Tepidisphaeraceae bacterium]